MLVVTLQPAGAGMQALSSAYFHANHVSVCDVWLLGDAEAQTTWFYRIVT
jgi:hypothetical protein